MKRLALSIICVLFWLTVGTARAEGPVTAEKIAILAPQPVAPSTEGISGLRVTRLEIPSQGLQEIQPYYVTFGWNDFQAAYVWRDDPSERDSRGCWGVYRGEYEEVNGDNITLWCHRQARVGNNIVDLALLKLGDPVHVWIQDRNGEYYAVEFTVRWMGLLPREVESDFQNPTDGWVLTLITCSIEPGLPENPKNRIFIRATIDERTNYGVWYTARVGDTISSIAKNFGISAPVLAEANNLPDPNKIQAGQLLFVPLTQRTIVENY
ncbi:MAG: LysM peptidoglycan-binding domain-containing protein [Patescibacteria group bacterium]